MSGFSIDRLSIQVIYASEAGGEAGDARSGGLCQASKPSLTALRASAITSRTDRPFVSIAGWIRSRTLRGFFFRYQQHGVWFWVGWDQFDRYVVDPVVAFRRARERVRGEPENGQVSDKGI